MKQKAEEKVCTNGIYFDFFCHFFNIDLQPVQGLRGQAQESEVVERARHRRASKIRKVCCVNTDTQDTAADGEWLIR